ncbi:hypothetical protein I7I53_01875 [Histoplasma capsulatum var. duboisii H88]|uniref:Uncharacterized protein n=1 Tax=Ajellomyces capsulatus (strain H88) TaxID=544711 RepID=A0A8A1LPI5_AJEC8|nr:hypothetical protein I7I53_01875 [Histoplasma capsulatum var. duboisii H88]
MPVFGNEVEDKEVQESSQHKEQNRTRYDGYLEQNFQLLGPFYNIYYVAKHWCLSKKNKKKLHPDYSGVATSAATAKSAVMIARALGLACVRPCLTGINITNAQHRRKEAGSFCLSCRHAAACEEKLLKDVARPPHC